MVGYLAGSADTGVRETLAEGPAKSVAVQVSTRLADDSEHQADAVQQLIDDAFTGVEVATHRTVHSNPAGASVGDRTESVILLADPAIAEHATLVDGSWPGSTSMTQPATAALQTTAAEKLGLAVGDEFTVEGHEFVVEATWLPSRTTDAYWFADPAVASGTDQLSSGPVVTLEGALAELPVRSYAQWTIVPADAALTADGLPALATALNDLAIGVERIDAEQAIELSGSLPDRVAEVQRGLGVASALVTVPAVLVAVIGLITLAQLARLLVSVRRTETALLRARGASVTQLTVLSLVEAAAATIAGTAVGSVDVLALLGAGMIPLNLPATIAAVWPVALAVAAVSVAVCGTVS